MLSAIALAAGLLAALWLAVAALVGLGYRRTLAALWREPVWRHPVLVLESDDWGAGPLQQAQALDALSAVLQRHRDASGRHAVMSLALVLAVPDGAALRSGGVYRRLELDDARMAPVLDALREGRARGVFSLQLHGLEHYWPPTLLACAEPAVQAWLRQDEVATTERLPSHLQSRWIDAHRLPSADLAAQPLRDAVAEEVRVYTRVVGERPRLVVPPTFVWTRECERAWAAQGIAGIVTPGWRYTARGADGLPCGDEGPIACGDRDGALTYLARVDYFEPARGRDALYALLALERATRLGRACLLENHRDNFIDDPSTCERSLEQLDQFFRQALRQHPGLRFLSSAEVLRILRERDPAWLHAGWRERLPRRWQRLRDSGRPWKLLRWSGLAAVGALAVRVVAR